MSQETEIDGVKFYREFLPVRASIRFSARVTQLAAPAVAAMQSVENPDFNTETLAPVLAALMRSLSPDEADALQDAVFASVGFEWNGKRQKMLAKAGDSSEPAYSVALAGREDVVIKAMAWALEAQYGRFFADVRAWLAGLMARLRPSSAESTT